MTGYRVCSSGQVWDQGSSGCPWGGGGGGGGGGGDQTCHYHDITADRPGTKGDAESSWVRPDVPQVMGLKWLARVAQRVSPKCTPIGLIEVWFPMVGTNGIHRE